MTTYIADTNHYSQVIAQIPKVKRLLWIATADLKDLYVEKKGGAVVPLLQILNDLVKKGVEVRLIHAKEPGTAFREDFDKYPALLRPRQGAKAPLHHSLWRYFYRHYPHGFSSSPSIDNRKISSIVPDTIRSFNSSKMH